MGDLSGKIRVWAFLAALLFLLACGPSIPRSIQTPDLPRMVERAKAGGGGEEVSLSLEEVRDNRPSEDVAEFHGRGTKLEGDAAEFVYRALKKAFVDSGYRLTHSAPVRVHGQLREWIAEVSGGTTARIHAKATVAIEVEDPAGRRIYSSVFRGYSELQKTGVNGEDLRRTLGSAMAQCLTELINDEQLGGVLSAF